MLVGIASVFGSLNTRSSLAMDKVNDCLINTTGDGGKDAVCPAYKYAGDDARIQLVPPLPSLHPSPQARQHFTPGEPMTQLLTNVDFLG